jgi:hypothetical protein
LTPAEALKAAGRAGVELHLDGDVLVLTGATPPAATILDGLRTHKRGVVRLLQVAAAQAKRPMDYLVGEAAVAPPVTASATEGGAREAIPLPLLDDLVDRLAVVWAKPTPWQRVVNPAKALPYLKARARLTLAPLDPVSRDLFVSTEEKAFAAPRERRYAN